MKAVFHSAFRKRQTSTLDPDQSVYRDMTNERSDHPPDPGYDGQHATTKASPLAKVATPPPSICSITWIPLVTRKCNAPERDSENVGVSHLRHFAKYHACITKNASPRCSDQLEGDSDTILSRRIELDGAA